MAFNTKTSRFSTAARLTVAGVAVAAGSAILAPTASAAPDSDWDRLAQCESGGNWHINTGNGYYGGLQFSAGTWNGFGGQEFGAFAHHASREEQIVVAERVLAAQGWGAWPSCSKKLGLNSAPTPRTAPGRPAAAPAPAAAATPAAANQQLAQAATVGQLDDIYNGIVAQARNAGVAVPQQVTDLYQSLRAQLSNAVAPVAGQVQGVADQAQGITGQVQNQVQGYAAQLQAALPR
ncbi:resuscitation-promoting factor Rpf1 domain-containing protein [Corynebacterium falsenii]